MRAIGPGRFMHARPISPCAMNADHAQHFCKEILRTQVPDFGDTIQIQPDDIALLVQNQHPFLERSHDAHIHESPAIAGSRRVDAMTAFVPQGLDMSVLAPQPERDDHDRRRRHQGRPGQGVP